jgi:hypothetical protein
MKTTQNKNVKILSALTFSGLALLMAGCGSSSGQSSAVSTPAPAPTATAAAAVASSSAGAISCSSGQVSVQGLACQTGDFASVCSMNYGQVTTIGSTQVCKSVLSYAPGASSTNFSANPYLASREYSLPLFPILTPASASASTAFNTGFNLRPNDKLAIAASGGWSQGHSFSFSFGSSNNCSDISVSGADSSGNVQSANGGAEGLYASDSTATFLVGTSLNQTISNAGALRIGINAPSSATNLCQMVTITSLTVTRCEDASGNTYVCP